QLRGHFDPVQCCAYRPRTQEVVTCGADGLVLLWSAAGAPWASRASYLPPPLAAGAGGTKRRLGETTEDQDMWSSDDEGGDGSRPSPGFDARAAAPEGVGDSTNSSRDGRSSAGGSGAFVPPILTQSRRAGR
ncbi:unnamed protein product, partial [Ectocarpus fasciculatus]